MTEARDTIKFVHTALRSQEVALIQIENVMEKIPCVFILLNAGLKIVRVNFMGCILLKRPEDQMVGRPLSDFLSASSFTTMKGLLESLNERKDTSNTIEAGITLTSDEEAGRYSMRASRIEMPGNSEVLFSLVGTDLTEITSLKSQVETVFADLRGAILILNSSGSIDTPFIPAAEEFLELSALQLKDLHSAWSELARRRVQGETQDAWYTLPSLLGLNTKQFERAKESLPDRVFIKSVNSDQMRSFKLTYTAIGENRVDRLMVLFNDVSAEEHVEAEKKRNAIKEKQRIEREKQIEGIENSLIPTILREMTSLNQKSQFCLKAKDVDALSRNLHGFKGNARCLSLSRLTDLIMETELLIGKARTSKILDWESLIQKMTEMEAEWTEVSALLTKKTSSMPAAKVDQGSAELFTLMSSLSGSTENNLALEELVAKYSQANLVPLEDLAPILRLYGQDAERRESKPCDININVESVMVDKRIFQNVSEVANHLISNSIHHGIEPAAVREQKGKPAKGRIDITVKVSGQGLQLAVSDDGQGVDTRKVRRKAYQQGLYTLDQLAVMNIDTINALIFHPGMSTASEITNVAGMGVGLDAVKTMVEERHGRLYLESENGCVFRVWLPRYAIQLNSSMQQVSPLIESLGSDLEGIEWDLESLSLSGNPIHAITRMDPGKIRFAAFSLNRFIQKTLRSKTTGHLGVTLEPVARLTLTFKPEKSDFGSRLDNWLKGKDGLYVQEVLRLHGGDIRVEGEFIRMNLIRWYEPSKNLPAFAYALGEAAEATVQTRLKDFKKFMTQEGFRFMEEENDDSDMIELDSAFMESLLRDGSDLDKLRDRFIKEIPRFTLFSELD